MKNLLIALTADQIRGMMHGDSCGERIIPLDDESVIVVRIERVRVGALIGAVADRIALKDAMRL